jgi:hypothetical protein
MAPPKLLVLSLLLLACDLEETVADAAQAAKEAQTKQAQPTQAPDPQGDAKPERAECLAACDADTTLSETDRATCRLRCGPTEKPDAAYGAKTVRAFKACVDGCGAEAEGSDAETCRLNCAGKIAADTQEPSARSCVTTCLEDLAACDSACAMPKTAETDQATCRLHCETRTEPCVESCL